MRALIVLILTLSGIASAAFLGSNPQRKITATATSASDTLKAGGSQVLLTVTGNGTGAFVTMATTFPCTAKRDTATAANYSVFVAKGVPTVRTRPENARCIAMISADSAAVLRFETGSGAP
jgi:hypothetical protein